MEALSQWLVSRGRAQKRLIQIVADIFLISLSLILAMALRLDGLSFLALDGMLPRLASALLVLIPVSLSVFVKLGFYRAVVRYISSRALRAMLIGVIISSCVLAVSNFILNLGLPRSVSLIYALLAFSFISGLRFFIKGMLAESQAKSRRKVIIYGAGASGRQLQMSLLNSPEYLPVAFIDDDENIQGRFIGGCPVLPFHRIRQVVQNYGVTRLLLAMPSMSRSERSQLLGRLDDIAVQVQTIPSAADLVSGKIQISEIRDVPVEDLLGRDPVPPREDLMCRDVRGQVVMVTGAGGSIGSELCRQILNYGPKRLILFEVSEYNLYAIDQELTFLVSRHNLSVEIIPLIGSVQDYERVLSSLRAYGVETVYHAAAYKHVPLVEGNVIEGIRNNVFGTKTLVNAAVEARVKAFILISTDKAVRPTNIMGASKRMAELICQAMARHQEITRFSMVRFGNVLGSSGSVIPLFQRQIAEGGPVLVTDPEITRYFMTIPEAAQLVIQAGAMSKGGDVFVLDMGKPIRIVDLAQRMLRLSGHNPIIVEGNSSERATTAADIEIHFSGLRPGEKLYEELLIGDDFRTTEHSRILAANEIYIGYEELEALLRQMLRQCDEQKIDGIKSTLIQAKTAYMEMSSEPIKTVA